MAHQQTGFWIGALLISTHTFAATASPQAETPIEMLTRGSAQLDLRYRYEYVDQDNRPENAHSSTLRSRLTLTSAELAKISAGVELDYVSRLGAERYNTLANGRTRYPVVPDADGFSLNQAWLRYRDDGLTATAGRQRILHGSQRFVGGVGWRQNEQTYDATRVELDLSPDWRVDYAYVWDVDRIFGPDTGGVQPRRFDSDSHFLRSDYRLDEDHQVSAFSYLLDFDNAFAASSQTYGLEYSGKFGPAKLTAAAARQSDYRDNPTDYETNYYMAELAAPVGKTTVGVGYEVLGSDSGRVGFATPLATLHKFNGWADAFLVTPAAGLRDAYVTVAGSAGPVKLAAAYHDFEPDHGSGDFGSEWNLAATLPISKQWMAQLKYANFQARDVGADLAKAWLTVQFRY